jgi:hypothetical protein
MHLSHTTPLAMIQARDASPSLGDLQPRDAAFYEAEWECIDRNNILTELLSAVGQGQTPRAEPVEGLMSASGDAGADIIEGRQGC